MKRRSPLKPILSTTRSIQMSPRKPSSTSRPLMESSTLSASPRTFMKAHGIDDLSDEEQEVQSSPRRLFTNEKESRGIGRVEKVESIPFEIYQDDGEGDSSFLASEIAFQDDETDWTSDGAEDDSENKRPILPVELVTNMDPPRRATTPPPINVNSSPKLNTILPFRATTPSPNASPSSSTTSAPPSIFGESLASTFLSRSNSFSLLPSFTILESPPNRSPVRGKRLSEEGLDQRIAKKGRISNE